jgi:hypothetical protein
MTAYISVLLRCDGPAGTKRCPTQADIDSGHEDVDNARGYVRDEHGWSEGEGIDQDLCPDCTATPIGDPR